MNERGPEILPGTWEHDWVSSVVAKAAEYSGRPSHWNGKLYEQAGPVAGLCHADGSMTISRPYVLDQARPVYTAEQTPSDDELFAAASATRAALFQAHVSLSDVGDDSVPGATPNGSLEDIALENARADRFTQKYGGRAAEDLTQHPLPMHSQAAAFPAYTTATDELMYPLVPATGTPLNELRDLIDSAERPQRFNAIADRVIDTQLGDLVPESHRTQLREDLTGPMRRTLAGLAMTEHSRLTEPGRKFAWGERSAQYTGLEFTANLDDIKQHYQSWNAKHPGVEPPELPESVRDKFLHRQEEIRDIWANEGWPALRPVPGYEQNAQLPEQPNPTAHQQEVAQLQKFLWSHTAPSQSSSTGADAGAKVRDISTARSKPDRRIE
jgi:hypothetical protein